LYILWYKAYGGTGWDWGWDAVEALNGGYVMVGEGADVFGNPSILDCMITKTDSAGNCGSCTWTNVNWAPQSFTPEVGDPAFITATLAVSVSTVTAEARNVISMDSLFCQQSYQLTPHFSSTEVCFNDTTRFTGTSLCSANSWFWDFDDPASGTDNTSVLQNPTHIFTTPGTYDVTHIASNGITSDTIIQGVTVYPPPSADAGTDTIICGGNSVQLNGYGGSSYPCNPSPYLWSPGVTLSDSTIANPVAFPLETTMYYLTVRDTNGCISSDSIQVAFSPLSIYVSPDVFICEGNFGTASVTVINGNPPYNYSWSNSATSSNITGLTAGSYIVTVTDITGCFQTDSVIITQSVITATITTTNSDCNNVNGTATISAGGGSPPYTYLWSNSQTSLTATGLATGTYTVTVTDSEECTKVESFLITQSLITANTTVTDAFCGNDNGTATISPNGGSPPYTYQWSNSLTSSTATGLAAGSYNVTVTDSNNCYQVSSFTVNAIPGPTAEAGPDLTINIGNMATLNAGGGEAYLWNTGDTTATINVSPQIATVYCVTVTDTLGCSGTACVNVFVEIPCPTNDDLSVPNAFSPNNDGNNDDFCLQGWDYCISVFIVYIFDRWGEKVFESSDPEFCWDGTYKGKPMDAAVFVYYISAVLNNNDKITRTGNISLIR
jgi:gliding motility-associated-like protein